MSTRASRYELLLKLASGGMATVYVGRVRGPLGFSRLVAIKRAHPHLLEDEAFVRMLVDEAKLASRIHHPNVVAVLDIERNKKERGGVELRLVMDYVEGAALSELVQLAEKAERSLEPGVTLRILLDACAGLQVAHELTDESGEPLGLVHRDVSPHNILVGVDGLTRLSDFGIAKATSRPGSTTTGSLKGKLAYMAPEYVAGEAIDARADVFGLGVVVWETLARRKLFKGANDVDTIQRVASAEAPRLSGVAPWVGTAFDDVIALALAKAPSERFSSARAFGNALEAEAKASGMLAAHTDVAKLVRELAKETLATRREQIRARVRELDAMATSSSTQDSLQEASQAAQRIIADATPEPVLPSAPADLVTADPPPPVAGVDATLDGSGVTSAAPSVSSILIPRNRSMLRWVVPAAVAGALAVIGWWKLSGVGPDDVGSAAGASTSVAPSAADAAPSTSAAQDVATAAVSTGASARTEASGVANGGVPSSSATSKPTRQEKPAGSARPVPGGPRATSGTDALTPGKNPY